MIKRSKRPILLLEVMIAIALIVMAAIPLIYPYFYLLRTQRHFMDKVELDHAVNLHYVNLLEKLYKNEVSWASIVNELEFSISREELQSLPFKGSYRFKVENFKPKGEPGAALTLYLIGLDYLFVSPSEEKKDLKYHYDLFIARDLGNGQLPQGDEEEEQEESDQEESS